jgi:hypothetical protein
MLVDDFGTSSPQPAPASHPFPMDSLFGVLVALTYWRFAVCFAGAFAAAVLLSNALVWFTAGYCLSLVLFGSAMGFVWQRHRNTRHLPIQPMPSSPISKSIAFIGYLFIGLVWAGVASSLTIAPSIVGLFLVSAVVAVAAWYRFVLKRTVAFPHFMLAAGSMLLGCIAVVLLQMVVD